MPDEDSPRQPDCPLQAGSPRQLHRADLGLPPYDPSSPIPPTVQPQPHLSPSTLPGLRVSGVPARADGLGMRRPAGVEKPIQASRPLVASGEYTLSLCAPAVYVVTC